MPTPTMALQVECNRWHNRWAEQDGILSLNCSTGSRLGEGSPGNEPIMSSLERKCARRPGPLHRTTRSCLSHANYWTAQPENPCRIHFLGFSQAWMHIVPGADSPHSLLSPRIRGKARVAGR